MDNRTEEQREVTDKILKIIDNMITTGNKHNPYVSLIGSAGVGKTFSTDFIVGELLNSGYRVQATAPTHKALRVLRKNLNAYEENQRIGFSTIHSFLDLKLKPNYETGLQEIVRDTVRKGAKSTNKTCDILILDEASMLSEELFKFIQDAVRQQRIKVLLTVGDKVQLKAVDGGENPVYNEKAPIIHYELTKIVRQAEGSSIIQLGSKLRDIIVNETYIPLSEVFIENTDEIELFSDSKTFVEDYVETYKSNEDLVLASYTNASVDKYNKALRKIITGKDELYAVGDILVMQDVVTCGEEVLIQNGKEIYVKECTFKPNEEYGLDLWYIVGEEDAFYVVDNDSLPKLKKVLDELKDSAIKSQGRAKGEAWKAFYDLKGRYGSVKYHFASSIHKLQGSTYDEVYFNFRELKNYTQDLDALFRLIYVAVTRAKSKVKVLL